MNQRKNSHPGKIAKLESISNCLLILSLVAPSIYASLPAEAKSITILNVKLGNRFDGAGLDLSAADGPVEQWGDPDIQWFTKELKTLTTKYPGLFEKFDKLTIFRVKRINVPDQHKTGMTIRTLSATTPGALFFSDECCKLEEQERRFSLVHEIVHAADIGNLVAYSPEFTAFDATYSKSVLPKPKVREALPEELADSVARYFEGGLSKSDRTTFEAKILPLITSSDQNRKSFNIQCTKALLAQKLQRYPDAISNWTAASALFPKSPFPHVSMGYCYIKQKKMDEALAESDLAQNCFVTAGVPESEPRRLVHSYQRALLLVQCKQDLEGALRMINMVVKYDPSPTTLKLRTALQEKLKKRPRQTKSG